MKLGFEFPDSYVEVKEFNEFSDEDKFGKKFVYDPDRDTHKNCTLVKEGFQLDTYENTVYKFSNFYLEGDDFKHYEHYIMAMTTPWNLRFDMIEKDVSLEIKEQMNSSYTYIHFDHLQHIVSCTYSKGLEALIEYHKGKLKIDNLTVEYVEETDIIS